MPEIHRLDLTEEQSVKYVDGKDAVRAISFFVAQTRGVLTPLAGVSWKL